jgi:hypothetical protein
MSEDRDSQTVLLEVGTEVQTEAIGTPRFTQSSLAPHPSLFTATGMSGSGSSLAPGHPDEELPSAE